MEHASVGLVLTKQSKGQRARGVHGSASSSSSWEGQPARPCSSRIRGGVSYPSCPLLDGGGSVLGFSAVGFRALWTRAGSAFDVRPVGVGYQAGWMSGRTVLDARLVGVLPPRISGCTTRATATGRISKGSLSLSLCLSLPLPPSLSLSLARSRCDCARPCLWSRWGLVAGRGDVGAEEMSGRADVSPIGAKKNTYKSEAQRDSILSRTNSITRPDLSCTFCIQHHRPTRRLIEREDLLSMAPAPAMKTPRSDVSPVGSQSLAARSKGKAAQPPTTASKD